MAWAKSVGAVGVLILAAVVVSGCAALMLGAAAGGAAAGALYFKGELKADVDATPPEVIAATEKAFRDLIWAKDTAAASATDGLATARTATGKEVRVTVEMKTPAVSSIGIRIGTFGDENLSRLLYDRIVTFLQS